MDKKIFLITGASGGLGTSVSNYLHEEGHSLILIYNNNVPKLMESENVFHFKCDFTKPREVERLIENIVTKFDNIDVLINNAGVSKSEISWKHSSDNWNETIAVNLTAPFILSKGVLPLMRKNKFGRIINITSIVAQTGVVGTSSYAASKAGLIGLTKTLSKEVAKDSITVNSLALGYFNKGMINDVPEDLKNQIKSNIPKEKLGDPKVICETISFLISKNADYITGQTLNLNGGLFS